MDLSKLLNIQQEQRENLTQGEIQALYIYLSMQFENMNDAMMYVMRYGND